MNALCNKKVLAGGKVVLVNFLLLNPDKFKPLYNLTRKTIKKETALFTPDGKIYVNSTDPYGEVTAGMFEILAGQTKDTLDEYMEVYSEKYPEATNGNIEKYKDSENNGFMEALALICIPVEFKRREIERSYYGK